MRARFASPAGGMMGGNVMQGAGGNFYSPELSTDFLELPQSLHENWNYYRFFYRTDPFVGQAVDLRTELPLSKIRISKPKIKDDRMAEQATRFCVKWAQRIGLLERLLGIVFDRNLIGEVFIWCEDANPDMPPDVEYELIYELDADGNPVERKQRHEDADDRIVNWMMKNYKGWTSVRVLPPEQVHMQSFSFTDERIFELIPDSKTKDIIYKADSGDPSALRIVKSIPEEIVNAVRDGVNAPLNTDPMAGSFIFHLANSKSDYESRGHSILERCMRVLVYRDKLRQAQTSIASRHMTPMRLIWAADMSMADTEALREQVDLALQDPDFSIITNYEVNWNEMGAEQRLLDLSSEYDLTNSQLYAGLGVTEGLLSGESSYSGDRISLEVINTRFMLLREQLQNLVENYFFKPMCARMGFISTDEDGEEFVVVPKLSFTRLALRDNQDTFDALYNLYTKGSLDVETILELLNLDPNAVKERIERDMMWVNDPIFNEVLRSMYGDVGRKVVEESDFAERMITKLGLAMKPPADEGGRF
jgi:hypothetical protein